MPPATIKFVTEVSLHEGDNDIDLMEAIEIVRTLLKRMEADPTITLPDGRVIPLKLNVDLSAADHIVHDPAAAFKAGATEAQDRPLREGLLSPRQFPTTEP
jgi:hypothetical protein